MKLYFAPNSRAVRIAWLLEELGMDYEIEKYSVGDKALRTPEYYKLHPMGRVPVLEDESVKIYESGAIVEYLISKYDKGKFCPDKTDPSFPYYLQWLHYAEGSIMPQVNKIAIIIADRNSFIFFYLVCSFYDLLCLFFLLCVLLKSGTRGFLYLASNKENKKKKQ